MRIGRPYMGSPSAPGCCRLVPCRQRRRSHRQDRKPPIAWAPVKCGSAPGSAGGMDRREAPADPRGCRIPERDPSREGSHPRAVHRFRAPAGRQYRSASHPRRVRVSVSRIQQGPALPRTLPGSIDRRQHDEDHHIVDILGHSRPASAAGAVCRHVKQSILQVRVMAASQRSRAA